MLFGFRLWCVVELHAALHFGKPVIIRAGKAAREGDAVKFDTEGAHNMLHNLSRMIDVERAECAVRADYDREMDAVQNGEGVKNVNKRVAGAVFGGSVSARQQVFEADAAVCGEPEALRALPRDRVEPALAVAAAGGRHTAVEELVARGLAGADDDGLTKVQRRVQLDDAPQAEPEEHLLRGDAVFALEKRRAIFGVPHKLLRDLAVDDGRRDQERRAASDHAAEIEVGAVARPLAHLHAIEGGERERVTRRRRRASSPPRLSRRARVPQTHRSTRRGRVARPRTPPSRGRPTPRPSSAT